MSWNADNFSEYSFSEYRQPAQPQGPDYADPRFYQQMPAQGVGEAPHFAQPAPERRVAQQFVPAYEPDYTANGYETAQMSEYRGPASLENYTVDVGTEQRAAAESGHTDAAGGKKKGLAGLGGLGAAIIGILIKFQGLLLIFA